MFVRWDPMSWLVDRSREGRSYVSLGGCMSYWVFLVNGIGHLKRNQTCSSISDKDESLPEVGSMLPRSPRHA